MTVITQNRKQNHNHPRVVSLEEIDALQQNYKNIDNKDTFFNIAQSEDAERVLRKALGSSCEDRDQYRLFYKARTTITNSDIYKSDASQPEMAALLALKMKVDVSELFPIIGAVITEYKNESVDSL